MFFNKKHPVLLLLLFLSGVCMAQVSGKYYFFQGDTLAGFDVNACISHVSDEHFSATEMFNYVKNQEKQFVEQKYHIPSSFKKFGPQYNVLAAGCTNLGFETGDFTGWTGYVGQNDNSTLPVTLITAGITTLGVDAAETSCSPFTIVNAAAGNDPWGNFPMLDPLPIGGASSLRLGGENENHESASPCGGNTSGPSQGESIQQTFQVTAANAMLTYNYAVVLVQPATNHTATNCPYFRAEVLDSVGNPIPCLQYYIEAFSGTAPPGMLTSALQWKNQTVFYCPWTSNSLNLKNFIGHPVTVRFSAAGCNPGGHFGYGYVDASCGPIQIIASSPEVCLGGTVNLTSPSAGATGTYAWSTVPPGGPGIVGSSTNQTVTVNASGTYEILVTQAPGCTYTIDTTIAFYPIPVVTATSTNASCSPGNDGTATAVVTGVPANGYTVSWAPTPGAGQGTLNATKLPPGNYTVTITGTGGCIATTSVVVTQPPAAPVVTLSNTPASCSPGADGTATATVTPAGAYTYTWSPAPPFGQGTLNATGLNGGVYTFTATPASGCAGTGTTTVTQPNGPSATFTSTNVSCFGLSDGTITVTASNGTPTYSYAWTGGPTVIASTTNIATGLAAGTYTCTIQDSKGCSIPQVITITQPTVLAVTASGIAATCFGKCNGQIICIPTGGTTTYTYAWTGSGCTSASCNNICAGTYTANITDAHGCTASATATVGQPTPIVLTMFPTPSHCSKPDGADSVFASGGTPGYTYSWTPGPGSTTAGYHNIPNGTYSVIVKDNNGCADTSTNIVPTLPGVNITQVSFTPVTCFGGHDGTAKDSASGGFPPYTFLWTGGAGTAATAANLAAGTYTCTVTDAKGCTNFVPVTIPQPPLLTLTIGPPATICIGQCTDLTATAAGGSPAYTYAWVQNAVAIPSTHVCPLTTTTYTVGVSDSHGCIVAPLTVTITVDPPLEVVTANAANICPGGSDTLHAIGSGGNGNYSYLWMPAAGLNNPNSQNPIATPAVTTTYTVIVSDNCGTPTDSAFVTVTLWPLPVVSFVTKDTVKCAPMCATFYGTSNPACQVGLWTFGDGGTGGSCDSIRHCYTTAGTYNVSYFVTDIHGCKGSSTVPNFINALPRPVAAFTDAPQPTTIVAPTITFTDQSTNAITWLWNFGDPSDSSSIIQNPRFTYLDTGCYNVLLTVTSTNGCRDSVMHPICIQPEFDFYAPNTFTPNGDGINDEWFPKGIGISLNDYDMMIFDRWGNLLYETHTWGQGWDGRANGGSNIAQIDTYVWKVNLLDVFGNKHQYIGHCNIVK